MEPTLKPNATTTPKPMLVCGDECPYIYRKVQHVCARTTNNLWLNGCKDNCWGNWIDDLTGGFRTFDTYCEFLNAQCRSPVHDKWMFLHSGKCISGVDVYLKPISQASQLLSRVTEYYTQLSSARASHSLPPINFS
ncbi:uncharacterized protein [Maniola hyperantus]|uniref:uncharacterized protein n=1 Tax=Aphantopus hyperantus TaxID=2795564 RepID=UPI0037486A95